MKRIAIILALMAMCAMAKAQATAHNPNDPNFTLKCATGQQLMYTITSNKEPYTVIVNGIKGDASNAKKLQIPETVHYRNTDFAITEINNNAFSDISSLATVTIPKTVKAIGDKAFFGCKALKSIKIEGIIESCGENAFAGTNITKPIYTGNNLVYYPTAQNGYKINEGTEKILGNAFCTCNNMTSITIPASVTELSASSFVNCTNIESIIVADGNKTFDSRNNCNSIIRTSDNTLVIGCKNSTIPEGVETIGSKAFAMTDLSKIEIANSVKVIEDFAFYGCKLANITIPTNIVKIGENAFCQNNNLSVVNFEAIKCQPNTQKASPFAQCMSLISVNFGENVKEVPNAMFLGCNELKYVTFSSSIENIGNEAFKECSSLSYIEIPSSIQKVGAFAFYKTNIYEPVFNDRLFIYYAGNDTEYKIPDGIKTICGNAFYENNTIKSLTIPNSVTTIDDFAFQGMAALENIIIPNSVSYLGKSAFKSCSHITSLTLPNSITKIETETFMNCSRLKTVTLPKTITEIDNNAFYWCDQLESITIQNPDIKVNKYSFNGLSVIKRINVPKGSKNRILGIVGNELEKVINEK